jgi:hypothetical protein
MRFDDLPDDALLRTPEIVRTVSKPGIVPHGREDWRKRVRAGDAPQPRYPLGPHLPMWTAADLRAYLHKLNGREKAPA